MPAVEATTPTIRKTALNAVHRQMGAKMVEYNGWDMPVEYPSAGGIMAEHNAVRTGVGIFDVSHMGDIRLAGPQALAAVQHISMNDAGRLAIGPLHLPQLGHRLPERLLQALIPGGHGVGSRVHGANGPLAASDDRQRPFGGTP